MEVFHTELEAFKHRVKEYAVKCRSESVNCVEQQNSGVNCRFDPKEALHALLPVSTPLPVSLSFMNYCCGSMQLRDGAIELWYFSPLL